MRYNSFNCVLSTFLIKLIIATAADRVGGSVEPHFMQDKTIIERLENTFYLGKKPSNYSIENVIVIIMFIYFAVFILVQIPGPLRGPKVRVL